ncbi:MAG: hypothetical protein RJA22_3188 [Verrucomicrobiota bacterium]
MLTRGRPGLRRVCLALLAAAAALAGARAAVESAYLVDRWEDDLPQNSVITLAQSRDGYLWLGTLGGLARFDGRRFEVFDEGNTPGLNSSRIVRLFEDRQGRMWIGTANAGIAVLAGGRVTSTGMGQGGQLAGACEDAAGGVWLCNSDGQIWRVQGELTNRIAFAADQFSVERLGAARVLAAERDGPVWVGADQRLAAFRPGPAGALEREETILPGRLDALLASRQGGVWRLGGGRIQKWRDGRLERDVGPYPWRGVPVSATCEDADGNLVVGTLGQGLFQVDATGRSTALSTNNGLSYNFILSLHLDREGGLWVGTDGGGLNRVKPRRFQVVPETRGKVVQSVCEAPDGAVWMGFNAFARTDSGVGVLRSGRFEGYGETNGLSFLSVRSVLARGDGSLWAGTVGGVFVLRGDGPQFRPGWSLGDVQALHEDRQGRVWMGTGSGLASWDGRELQAVPALGGESVRALAQDAGGRLWVGTERSGLFRLGSGNVERFRQGPDGLPSDRISALLADVQGAIWVGTDGGGLARWRDGRWTRCGTSEGLGGNAISYLVEDGLGHLWIGGSIGLMRIGLREFEEFAAGRIPRVNCRTFGREDGLPTKECTRGSQPAAGRGRDGRLWFATIQGLVTVDPSRLPPNTNPPPVVIESVRIEGRPAASAPAPGAVTIPAGKQRIEVHYASLNLSAPRQTRFRYRLDGHDRAWTEVGDNRTVSFFKLEPGRYQLQVTACNEDGVWNPVPAQVALTVLPPFWRTWWFLTASALALLGAVVAAVHFISTQRLQRQVATLRQQEALERERARIARDIHDQLGANLTQVALLGELVEADKNSPPDVEDHARQICRTARETTRSLDEIVWTVNPANDTLEGLANYLCKYAQEYLAVAGLRCRLEVPAQLPPAPITPEVRHNVFLAAREAVTNIVRHARASSAWLRLRLEPGRFTFEIEDDGRGPGDTESARAKTRNGLRNMARRMEDVGGSFALTPAPERGTLVRLTAPLTPPPAKP